MVKALSMVHAKRITPFTAVMFTVGTIHTCSFKGVLCCKGSCYSYFNNVSNKRNNNYVLFSAREQHVPFYCLVEIFLTLMNKSKSEDYLITRWL